MKMNRFLRSRRLRALLWYAAGGRCQGCGIELPESWHADHVTPFSVSGRTNIHEMQALCPACNLKKGVRMPREKSAGGRRLRAHQEEFRRICRDIVGGEPIRQVIVSVTPGGGKSMIPVIAAAELIQAGLTDKLLWIVPRVSLREQAALAFLKPWLRDYLGHDLKIREAENHFDPTRGTAGAVITYQAMGMDSAVWREEFRRFRYILFADEVHHVGVGRPWEGPLLELVRSARLYIPMTGAGERGNGSPIATLPYRHVPGGQELDLTSTAERRVIVYGRKDALRERAIIRMEVHFMDGRAEWIDRGGNTRTIGSFDEATGEIGDAVYTVLRTGYALGLIDKAVRHWQSHRRLNPRSKILFVAPDIATAKVYMKHLATAGVTGAIATSEDSADALEVIRRFKKVGISGAIDALVTVAMAYEGMDVPSVTHLVCLTHIRSRPWIEQMIGRATRMDFGAGRWEDQRAYLFTPDDYDMRIILDQILQEQAAVLDLFEPTTAGGGEPGTPREVERVVPMASEMTAGRAMDLSDGEQMPTEEYMRYMDVMERNLISGVSPIQMKRAFADLASGTGPAPEVGDGPLVTDRVREDRLRAAIQGHCSAVDFKNGWDHGEANRRVRTRFGKPRDRMTLAELGEAWAWVQANLPIERRESCS